MKDLVRYFLSLSALERKGVILLIIIILAITGVNAFLLYHKPSGEIENKALLLKELQLFEQQLAAQNDSSVYLPRISGEEESGIVRLFNFDPNTASAGDLRSLGMSSRLVKTLLNYRIHGGRFHQKSDLNKIYGMSKGLYESLAPYINIVESSLPVTEMKYSATVASLVPVDINRADSAALNKLRGIGPVLSKRIIKYRALLGGFYDTMQLKEVYGISDSLILAIAPVIFADTTNIIKLNLNQASESELAGHPYIGKYVAKGIIRYRLKVQKIGCFDELKVNGLISAENLEKLKRYLTI
jgi:competence protein ComEA